MDATRTVGIDFSDPAVMADVLTSAIDNAPIAYAILDEAMRVHFVNEYFLKLRHIRRGDILGNYCYNVINEGKPCSVCSVRQALAAGRPEMVKRKDIHDNGTVSYLDDFAIPILNDDGRVEYVLEMMVDRSGEMQVLNTNEKVFLGIVRTLTSMLDMKDRYTSSHSNDVTEITVKLATYMGIGGRELDDLRLASLLHDLGKIVVPDEIISKPTKLSDEEYKIIQQHPVETFNMLSRLRQFQTIGFLAGSHHERWDGNGYPNRLKGDEIPFGARILAVADTYDAMTSDRPYRKALQHGRAVEEIRNNAGGQFDPDVSMLFVEMAENLYTSRPVLLGGGETKPTPRKKRSRQNIERRLTRVLRHTTRIVDNGKINKLLTDYQFAKSIMDSSPCHYLIIDGRFNILFASDSVARAEGLSMEELLTRRCFELGDGGLECFHVVDGTLRCPAVRAFQTGRAQNGYLKKKVDGKEIFLEVYAVPMTLTDQAGNAIPCALEILMDRTDENREREGMIHDIRALLELLLQLVGTLDARTTGSFMDIVNECERFSGYLSGMSLAMQKMRGAGNTCKHPKEAAGVDTVVITRN